IAAAPARLGEHLGELSLAGRIEAGRDEPNLQEIDTLGLAHGAASELGDDRVRVDGPGGTVRVDVDATQRGVSALAQAALRHGGFEEVECRADDGRLTITPVTPASGP